MADINEASTLPEPLTDREQEILLCLSEGLSNQEIGNRLYLSVKTVRWYNSQIYSKLGVNNREAALVAAEELSLLQGASASSLAENNLPAQTTAFVGRQAELAELVRLLDQPNTRLITILAPGGMGKTRLALAVAERQLRHFSDGAFFAPLAPLSSLDDIVTTIAESVSFSFYGSDPPQRQLLDYLRQRHLLLVLDNFEHLLDGAPLVTEILRAAPQVKVLATSREKLNLSGETIFTLSGLHFPDWETPEDALEYDAVILLMQNAYHVRPDFVLHPDHLDHLARICRLTDGMPLALVLAAGWLDMLTLEQIATELQQGIDILETEMRDVPDRQRSVRSTFNYTWARLDDAERDIFMKLSIFRGGFTAEAARAIAGANLRHLRQLVDKALLQVLPTGRYEIHELLRQYAENRLRDAGEADAAHAAHGHHYLDFLHQHEADLKGHKQVETLNAIDADRENIYAAWRWGVAHDMASAIAQAVEALSMYAHTLSHEIEVEALMRQALEHISAETYPRAWARLAIRHARLMKRALNSTQPFHDVIERCLIIAEEHQDLGEIAVCKFMMATHSWLYDRLSDKHAHELIREVLAIYEALNDPYYISHTLKWIGNLTADWDTALAYHNESIAVARAAGISNQVLWTIFSVGWAYLVRGHYTDAETAFQQGITLSVALRDRRIQMGTQKGLSLVEFFIGKFSEAHVHFEEAERIKIRYGLGFAVWFKDLPMLLLALDEDNLHEAAELSTAAIANRSEVRNALSFTANSVAAYAVGDPQTAWLEAMQGLKESEREKNLPFEIAALTIIAMLLADEGDHARAIELVSLALNHPASPRGWLEKWPLLTRKREGLQAQIGQEAYNTAWERGAQLDLEHVAAQLLAEYTDEIA